MNKSDKIDYLLSFVASLQPLVSIIQIFLNDALSYSEEYTSNLRILVTAMPIIIALPFIINRLGKLALGVYAIAVLIVLLNMIIHPETQDLTFLSTTRFLFPVLIPIGLCIASVKKIEIFEQTLYTFSLFTFFIGIIYFYFQIIGKLNISTYSMSFGYDLLIAAVVFYKDKRIISKLFLFLIIFMTLSIGSRGPLLAIISIFIISLLFTMKKIYIIAFLLLCIGLNIYLTQILLFLNDLTASFGIESRTLYLLTNDLVHDSDRSNIYESAWKIINNNPLFGAGLFADRYFFKAMCHNIILELLVDFGFLGGGAVIIAFVSKQYKIYNKLPLVYKKEYLIFLIAIMLPLMFSGSYLISYNLSFFIGFSFLLKHTKGQIKST
ncbi:MAG: O-antigen ligase family protein [Bacteroidales bacterium]|nr:O-antigen ligase family protein [Bacteroidales bacterium]